MDNEDQEGCFWGYPGTQMYRDNGSVSFSETRNVVWRCFLSAKLNVRFSQLGTAWANHGVKPRITPVNTRGVQELLGEDAKYKSIPVNYKNPVSSYIDLASEISRNQLKCVQRCLAHLPRTECSSQQTLRA